MKDESHIQQGASYGRFVAMIATSTLAEFENERGAWRRTLDRAFVFLEAWREIPASERAPSIQKTFSRATELTNFLMPDLATDELPPGYNLPGKGSHGIG